MVVAAYQLLKFRIIAYIDGIYIIIGTVVILKPGIMAHINASQSRIIPDVQSLHLRAARHIKICKAVPEGVQMGKVGIIAKIKGSEQT